MINTLEAYSQSNISTEIKPQENPRDRLESIFTNNSSGLIAHELKRVITEDIKNISGNFDFTLENGNKELSPVDYPQEIFGFTSLTKERIDQSMDKYISWRRTNEEKGGVLEPNRASVLAHSTSLEAVKGMQKDGKLKSIKNLILSENPHLELMQGGKARHIASSTEKIVQEHKDLQEYIFNNRDLLLNYLNSPFKKLFAKRAFENVKDFNELKAIFSNYAYEDASLTNSSKSKTSFKESGLDWRIMANILPQNIRKIIAENSYSEKYISFVLGHAITGYTPNDHDPSVQSAFVIGLNQYPTENLYKGGGSKDFQHLSQENLAEFVNDIETHKSRLLNAEYGSGPSSAKEISLMEDNDQGTAIDIKKGIFLVPESKKEDFDGKNNIVYFDDSKFKNVDEALGWLVTTPEGREVYKNSINNTPNV